MLPLGDNTCSVVIAAPMKGRGQRGSIVSLLCDRGERCAETLFNAAWRMARGIHVSPWLDALRACAASGRLADEIG